MTVLQTIDQDKFWKLTFGDFFSEFLQLFYSKMFWFNCLQIFVLFWDGGGDYNDKRLSGLNPSGAEL